MRKALLISVALFLPFLSCKKEEIVVGQIGKIQFYFNGDFGNENLLIEAGKDNYYHSNYNIVGDSLYPYQFRARFDRPTLRSSIGELEIFINNQRSYNASAEEFLKMLDSTSFTYHFAKLQKMAAISFNSHISNSASSFIWDFGDGGTSNEEYPTHFYKTDGEQSFNVCLNVLYDNGCSDIICSDVFLPDNLCAAQIQYALDSSSSNEVVYKAIMKGTEPIQYTWVFNDAIEVNTAEVKYSFESSTNSIQHVKLRTYDASGCETNTAIKHPIGNTTECYSNFNTIFYGYFDIIPPGYSQVVVNYTAENGKFYSSQFDMQPDQSSFKVISHESYTSQEIEGDFEAVDLLLNCKLYSEDGEAIELQNASARIAFELP